VCEIVVVDESAVAAEVVERSRRLLLLPCCPELGCGLLEESAPDRSVAPQLQGADRHSRLRRRKRVGVGYGNGLRLTAYLEGSVDVVGPDQMRPRGEHLRCRTAFRLVDEEPLGLRHRALRLCDV